MTAKRRAPESVMQNLCECVLEDRRWNSTASHDALNHAVDAYRAATAPLRTRQEVAKQALETLQRYLLISETNEGECSDILADTWTNLEELAGEMTCSEPTRAERCLNDDAHPCGKCSLCRARSEPSLVDRVLASNEPEACSCDESEGLKREVKRLLTLTESSTAPNTLEWRMMVDEMRAKLADIANHAQGGLGRQNYPSCMGETACREILRIARAEKYP